MRINSIELEGFGPFKNYTKVDIPDGITGIIAIRDGNLKKSNGNGKTNFIMSIIYAFFGEGEFEKLEELIHDEALSMYVKVNCTINGTMYFIERGIKKRASYFDVFENKPDNRLGDSITTTQELFNKIIGRDYSMFSASNFFEQTGMDKFINTKPETRREYFDKVLDLEIWRDLIKSTSKNMKKQEEEKHAITEHIGMLEESIIVLEKKLLEKSILEITITETIAQKNRIQNEIKLVSQYSEIVEQINNLKNDKTTQEEKIKNIDSELGLLKQRICTIELALITVNSTSIDNLNKDIIVLTQNKVEYFKELNTVKLNYDTETNKLINFIESLSKKIAEKNMCIQEKSDIISGNCPTCKQEVNTQLLVDHNLLLDNKVKLLTLDIQELCSQKETIELNIKNYETLKNNLTQNIEESMSSIDKAEYTIKVMETEIKINKESFDFFSEQLLIKNKEKGDTNNILNDITDRINLLTPQIQLINSIDSLEVLQKEFDELELIITQKNINLGKLIEINNQKETIINDLNKQQDALSICSHEIYYEKLVLEVLSIIPKTIFEESITSLEEMSNELIQQILPEISVNLYEDASKKNKPLVISFFENGHYRSYKRLSGGQKTIVNVGIRLAFSKVIATRCKTYIGFIAMDEPFGALDEENRDLIKKVLTIISEYFKQILVITHTSDVNDFPNIITVKSAHNISSIN